MFVYIPSKAEYRALSDIARAVVTKENTVRITWRSGLEMNTEYKGDDAVEIIAAIVKNTNKLASDTKISEVL